MKPNDFLKSIDTLENKDFETLQKRFSEVDNIRLLHAVIGMCTETGELQDAIKRKLLYGKDLDTTNMIEELGDVMWYLGLACNVLGVSLEQVMETNWNKLKTRYGNKLEFSENAAINRNKDLERKVLEDGKEQRG